mgnify:CR=1 FL=1|jgi:hypothetical protein
MDIQSVRRRVSGLELKRKIFIQRPIESMTLFGVVLTCLFSVMVFVPPTAGQTGNLGVRVNRLLDRPIITPSLYPTIGQNIQGPSLIRVPEWIEDPLGTYYLYFADHKGRYIRLAYADDLLGPWHVHPPGSLQIESRTS